MLENFFEKKSSYSIISHVEKDLITPLNVFCEKTFKIPAKHICASLLIFSSMAFINSFLTENKFEPQNIAHGLSFLQKQDYYINVNDINDLEADLIKKHLENEIAISEKSLYKDLDVKKITSKQFDFSLKELKEPAKANQKYYSDLYLHKIPSKNEIMNIADAYGVDGNLLFYIMYKESRHDSSKLSHKGAFGAYQFMEHTAKDFSLIQDGKDYRKNAFASTDGAARYLLWLNKLVNGENALLEDEQNLKYTLAAYNAGLSNVKFGNIKKIPNYQETLDYVETITMLYYGKGHIVKYGETIESIAEKYNVDNDALIRKNLEHLMNGNKGLKAGVVLNIEALSNDEITVKVEKNFSMYKISRALDIPVDQIAAVNNFSSNYKLKLGEEIVLPQKNREYSSLKNRNK